MRPHTFDGHDSAIVPVDPRIPANFWKTAPILSYFKGQSQYSIDTDWPKLFDTTAIAKNLQRCNLAYRYI